MHDQFALIDITSALLFAVVCYGIGRTRARARINNRRISQQEFFDIATLSTWCGLMPILFRQIHSGATIALLGSLIFLPRNIARWLRNRRERDEANGLDLAAGRMPLEMRVYNDWAKPDPE
jgi:hypothetical protein